MTNLFYYNTEARTGFEPVGALTDPSELATRYNKPLCHLAG